ncbi:MAG: OmpA family protein [Gammaproteobacteria bacterium]|jgi:outer membrane protein OmpA-like peptidoglycan-associated protein
MKNIARLAVALTVSGTLMVSGCTTYDAYTGEEKVSNTAKGAGIGAGVGAVVAYFANKDESSKERQKRMLAAAGVGAIAGGGVGYYMDSQEAKLRKQLRDSGVSVVREGDKINLIMPGNITFDTDKANIKTDFNKVLDSVALVLEEFDKTVIAVAGHTDSTGSRDYNQQLSEKRARSVANYLKTHNIVEARFDVVGFGEDYPLADNTTPEGRAQNRRVELTLIPITEEALES